MNYREICLREATRVACQSREQEYGSPEDSFQQIRELWGAYLGVTLGPYDVAMMMALLKIARIKTGRFKEDSFVDAAGYVACGYEIARKESEDQTRRENGDSFAVTNKGMAHMESEENFTASSEYKTASETGKRGESEAREESVTREDNDTPPDTDTQTETNPQTNTQTQFQFDVKDGEIKTSEEREAEVQRENCSSVFRDAQRGICSPVFRDAQRGIGTGFVRASTNGPGAPCELP